MSVEPRVFSTLRDAINFTVYQSGKPLKEIAAELDWSPSQLSMAATLGDDNARAFPLDDAHLLKLIRVTGNPSILHTLADLCGFDPASLRPKVVDVAREIAEARRAIEAGAARLEQLTLRWPPEKKR